MEDRYTGDVGDFIKLALLRFLVRGDPVLKLAINWYLSPNEDQNADGKHIGYLKPSNRQHASLERCDPDLMMRLKRKLSAP